MRGDPPHQTEEEFRMAESTPHARGSTSGFIFFLGYFLVYPACAGIHPQRFSLQWCLPCLPRMRGDPPHPPSEKKIEDKSTPHARGSTLWGGVNVGQLQVYPACAGIHLTVIQVR